MKKTYLIKVYHSYEKWKKYILGFFEDISKTLEDRKMTFWINYFWGEIFFSYTADASTYSAFESQFYSYFNDFQLIPDNKDVWGFDPSRTVVWELKLENSWFYPFNYTTTDHTEFIFNTFRSFENFWVVKDRVWIFLDVEPIVWESFKFFLKSKLQYFLFNLWLTFKFFKYILNHKIQKWWKGLWKKYFKHKLEQDLFEWKIFIVLQSENKSAAQWKLRALFNNFLVFKNYPLNQFNLKIHKNLKSFKEGNISWVKMKKYMFSSEELSSIFYFPNRPKNETSLLKVTAKKLALPIGVPTFNFSKVDSEIIPKNYPNDTNIIWVSDYRSITVPVGIYDEDRLRHLYIVWKTWTGKSKFLSSLMIDDLKQWRWLGMIDPHGDLIEEIIPYIPKERGKDVIIFDPTDEEFPFCFNPLDVKENESKQILAKWFIDIFHKFFWC